MMKVLRVAVVLIGAGFLLIGIAAALGPGFPIADPESKPLLQTYSQALSSLAYGGALVSSAFLSDPTNRVESPTIWLLILSPAALWLLSSTPFYLLVSGSGIAVLVRRRGA